VHRSRFNRVSTLGLALVFASALAACGGQGTSSLPSVGGGAGAAGHARSAAVTSATTFTDLLPLGFAESGGILDFQLSINAQTFAPTNTQNESTNEFDIPMTCDATSGGGGAVGAVGAAVRTADGASAEPSPTPMPTDLPETNCYIVAYSGGTAFVVAGPALDDSGTLIFPATPGMTYTMGQTYQFYIAIGAPQATPTPGDFGCANGKTVGHGHRHQHDNGNHKDCGEHNGDDHNDRPN